MEFNPRPEEIDFSQYWLTIKRHWFAGGSVFLFLIVLSGLIASLEQRQYQAEQISLSLRALMVLLKVQIQSKS